MPLGIPYRNSILLGAVGWLCPVYLRSAQLSYQVRSGEVLRVAGKALAGKIDWRTWDVAASLLPIWPLVFLAVLYLEAIGKTGATARRAGSAAAAILMLLTTSVVITHYPELPGPRSAWISALSTLSMSLYPAWALLIFIFAARREPLGSRFTAWTAVYIGLVTAILIGPVLFGIVFRAGFRIRLGTAIGLCYSTLIVLFSFTLARQRASG